ncbi:Protein hit [compost metagenome]
MNCVFCRIINRDIPGVFVYEDDSIVAIVPKEKVSEGHLLVLPKSHYQDVFDINDSTLRNLVSISKKLSTEIVSKSSFTAVNLLNASGKDAQQSVLHFHLHIVPRKPDDGLDMWIQQNL